MELTNELIAVAVLVVLGLTTVVAVWPTFGFALVLGISLVKSLLRSLAPAVMESFTYDMTVVLVTLLGATIHRLRRGGRDWHLPPAFMFSWLVIAALMWLRLPASHEAEQGLKNCLIFSIFCTSVCVLCPMFVVSLADARRVLRVVLGLGIVAVVGMLTIGERTEDWATARHSFAGAHVFGVANACVHGIIVLFGLWLAQRKLWQLITLMVCAPAFIFTIIASGTRAPILLTPMVMFLMVWLHRRKLNIKAIVAFTIGGAVVAAAVAAVLNPDLLYRFRAEAVREALETRTYLARITFAGFLTNPILGHGPGDTLYQIRTLSHPHNQVLEIANEIGIFGLLAYLIVVGHGLKAWWYLRRPEYEGTEAKNVGVTVFGLLLYSGLWTLKSGSYAGAYHFYFFITLMVVVQGVGRRTMNRQRRKAAVGSPQQASALLDKRGPGHALTGGPGSR
ncbi:MAG: O-antigen ligase family protein [Planctomycetes bacterium]|nr:O-antigen ligase family protein [Planctomycetota bacterium]